MRVWTVEMAAEYEVPAKCGTYATPHLAGIEFRDQVRKLAASTGNVEFELRSAQETDYSDPADVVLRAENTLGDAVILTGVFVRGTRDYPLNIDDWRELKDIVAQASREVSGQDSSRMTAWVRDTSTEGSWTLSRKP